MPRCTRSIVLVLLGTGLAAPGCDDRQRQSTTPTGTDGNPTTYPAEFDDGDGGDGFDPSPPYGYGPMIRSPGLGWIGGTTFNAYRRYGWWDDGYPWGRPYYYRRGTIGSRTFGSFARSSSSSFGHTFGSGRSSRSSSSSGTSASHGTTFGGFGSHGSSSHSAGG